MVDVSDKDVTQRSATARAEVHMSPATAERIASGDNPKGDVFTVARLAGIQAAKKTAELIPLCHPLALTAIDVDCELDLARHRVLLTAHCALAGRTGVEMEALTAVSVAALTLYDMCKALDPGMRIHGIQLVDKRGGRSGHWQAPELEGAP